MNKQLAGIVWIDATIAFFIPFGTTFGVALSPFLAVGAAAPSHLALGGMLLAACVAGASGLKSFLSTTVADAKATLLASPPAPKAP